MNSKKNNRFEAQTSTLDGSSPLTKALFMIKIKLKFFALFVLLLLWSAEAQAQESANSSGGDASGNSGTAAYSIGQVVFTSIEGSSGSESQGVQQAYKIANVGIEETALNISMSAFPNPTTETLTLEISNFNNEPLSYQLCDLNGKKLIQENIVAQQTYIDMCDIASATYFVYIVNATNKRIQTFKIIKTSK